MVRKLFSSKPDPEIMDLLRELVPPEVGQVSEEVLQKASCPRGEGMLEILGFKGWSFMDAMMGNSAMSTTRYGRQVSIQFGLTGMGKPTVNTHVAVVAAPFEVTDKDKNPASLSLPAGVADVFAQLGPLEKGVRVLGGADGITVDRKRSSKDAASAKGNIQWLSDLQLAERLADALNPPAF
jgi:hypothetical protein